MFWTLFRKEWLESWRTRRALILGVVMLVLGLMSPAAARFGPEIVKLASGDLVEMEAIMALIPTPTPTDSVDQFLKNLIQIGVLALILLAMGSVAREKDTGTVVMVLARPVSRTAFLLAKFATFSLLLLICLVAAAAICYLYTGLLFGEWLDPAAFLAINGLMCLYLLVPSTLTFLGSTLSRTSLPAAGIGLGAWLVLGLLGGVHALSDYAPSRLPAASAELARGLPFEGWPAVVACLALVVCLLGATVVVFRRQEL